MFAGVFASLSNIPQTVQTKDRLGFASDLLELYLLAFGLQLAFYTPV